MRRSIATSLLAAGLVAGAASPSFSAKPVQEGSYDWNKSNLVQNADGSCTLTITANLFDSKKPATGWLYARALDGLPFDSQFRLIDPDLANGNTFSISNAIDGPVYFALAPIVNKKVLPAEGNSFRCN